MCLRLASCSVSDALMDRRYLISNLDRDGDGIDDTVCLLLGEV